MPAFNMPLSDDEIVSIQRDFEAVWERFAQRFMRDSDVTFREACWAGYAAGINRPIVNILPRRRGVSVEGGKMFYREDE